MYKKYHSPCKKKKVTPHISDQSISGVVFLGRSCPIPVIAILILLILKQNLKQESIPVGCEPPAEIPLWTDTPRPRLRTETPLEGTWDQGQRPETRLRAVIIQ